MGFRVKWEQVQWVLVISPWLEGASGKLPGGQPNPEQDWGKAYPQGSNVK